MGHPDLVPPLLPRKGILILPAGPGCPPPSLSHPHQYHSLPPPLPPSSPYSTRQKHLYSTKTPNRLVKSGPARPNGPILGFTPSPRNIIHHPPSFPLPFGRPTFYPGHPRPFAPPRNVKHHGGLYSQHFQPQSMLYHRTHMMDSSSLTAAMSLADSMYSTPKAILPRIKSMYTSGQHEQLISLFYRLTLAHLRSILQELPPSIFIDTLPYSMNILDALLTSAIETNNDGRNNNNGYEIAHAMSNDNLTIASSSLDMLLKLKCLRPDSLIWQIVIYFANRADLLDNEEISSNKFECLSKRKLSLNDCFQHLIYLLCCSEPKLRLILSKRQRILTKCIEGLGQHGLLGSSDSSRQLINLYDALKIEFDKVQKAYNDAIDKLSALQLISGATSSGSTNRGSSSTTTLKSIGGTLKKSNSKLSKFSTVSPPIAQSHQRQLSLKSNEVQARLIKNKSLLNSVEPTLENSSLEVLLGILQKRIEFDKECLFQYTQICKDEHERKDLLVHGLPIDHNFRSKQSSSINSSNATSSDSRKNCPTHRDCIAPVLMRYQRACQKVLDLMSVVMPAVESATTSSSSRSIIESNSVTANPIQPHFSMESGSSSVNHGLRMSTTPLRYDGDNNSINSFDTLNVVATHRSGINRDREYGNDDDEDDETESCIMTSGNSPYISKQTRYNFISRSVRMGSKHSIRTSILASSNASSVARTDSASKISDVASHTSIQSFNHRQSNNRKNLISMDRKSMTTPHQQRLVYNSKTTPSNSSSGPLNKKQSNSSSSGVSSGSDSYDAHNSLNTSSGGDDSSVEEEECDISTLNRKSVGKPPIISDRMSHNKRSRSMERCLVAPHKESGDIKLLSSCRNDGHFTMMAIGHGTGLPQTDTFDRKPLNNRVKHLGGNPKRACSETDLSLRKRKTSNDVKDEPIYQGIDGVKDDDSVTSVDSDDELNDSTERDISVIRRELELNELNEEVKHLRCELDETKRNLHFAECERKERTTITAVQNRDFTSTGSNNGCEVSSGETSMNFTCVSAFSQLFTDHRVRALEALDTLTDLKEADELKNKLLFSVVVLSFRSVSSLLHHRRKKRNESSTETQSSSKSSSIDSRRMTKTRRKNWINHLTTSSRHGGSRSISFADEREEDQQRQSDDVDSTYQHSTTASTAGSDNDDDSSEILDGKQNKSMSKCCLRDRSEFDLRPIIHEVCNQIWATLYDYPCLKTCHGISDYVKRCTFVAWNLLNQSPPYKLEYEERSFQPNLHVRFHSSCHKSSVIRSYLWPALVQHHRNEPKESHRNVNDHHQSDSKRYKCLHKGVVIT